MYCTQSASVHLLWPCIREAKSCSFRCAPGVLFLNMYSTQRQETNTLCILFELCHESYAILIQRIIFQSRENCSLLWRVQFNLVLNQTELHCFTQYMSPSTTGHHVIMLLSVQQKTSHMRRCLVFSLSPYVLSVLYLLIYLTVAGLRLSKVEKIYSNWQTVSV